MKRLLADSGNDKSLAFNILPIPDFKIVFQPFIPTPGAPLHDARGLQLERNRICILSSGDVTDGIRSPWKLLEVPILTSFFFCSDSSRPR